MSLVVLDTSAWVALAQDDRAATRVEARMTDHTAVLTHVVLSELDSLAARGRLPPDVPSAILATSLVEPLTLEDAREGGRIHGASRARRSNLSLPDALILATARRLGANVLTLDEEMGREEGVESLR